MTGHAMTGMKDVNREQYSSSRHALGLYRNVITVSRYALPAAFREDGQDNQIKKIITSAVATVVRDRLPALRVGVAGEDTRTPVFVSVPSLDLREHMEWEVREQPSEEYDTQLAADLARDTRRPWWPDTGDTGIAARPPWRLVVYVNAAAGWADLAFALHHAVGDGKSGTVFHTHLVEVLNGQPAVVDAPDVLAFTDLPTLVPSQESLIRFTITWPFFVKTLWAELVPAWLKPGWLTPTTEHYNYTGPRVRLYDHPLDGRLRLFHLTPRQAAALLAGCRAHGTTLTALVQGLLMVLFARRIPVAEASSFVCLMPVSTRRIVPAVEGVDVDRQMGNFVCGHHYVYDAAAVADARQITSDNATEDDDDSRVWRAAAALGADLRARLADLATDNIMGLMAWVRDWHQYWRQQDGKVREGTWSVSNTGSISDGGRENGWRLTRNLYAQSSMGKDALVSVNVGSVRGGDLSFVVAWHRGVVTDAFAGSVADDLRGCLVRYAEVGRFAVPVHESMST